MWWIYNVLELKLIIITSLKIGMLPQIYLTWWDLEPKYIKWKVSDLEIKLLLWLILCVDLATGHPDIWFSIILGVSVRVLPDEINIGISRLSKADGPCLVWVGLQSFETWIEQKTEEGRICSLCLTVFELGHWFSPTFGLPTGTYIISSPDPQAAGLGLQLHHCLFWVASLQRARLGTFQLP